MYKASYTYLPNSTITKVSAYFIIYIYNEGLSSLPRGSTSDFFYCLWVLRVSCFIWKSIFLWVRVFPVLFGRVYCMWVSRDLRLV